MAEFWEEPHVRGQQTIGVWGTFAPAFTVGELTLAAHTADVALILTHVNEREVQKDVYDDAVSARDNNAAFIRDINVRAPGLIDATLSPDDDLRGDLGDVFNVDQRTIEGVTSRARVVISLWNRTNAKRAAATPPLGPLLVGTTAVAALQAAVNNHPSLLQTIENEQAELGQKRSQLRSTADRVDRNNKRWYKAWGNNYPPGTPENDGLSQVDTEHGTIAPTALAISSLTQAGTAVQIIYVAGGGLHASSLQLLYQVVGVDADFGHGSPVILTGQTVGPFPAAATVNFKTRGTNSVGTTDSPVQMIALTQGGGV